MNNDLGLKIIWWRPLHNFKIKETHEFIKESNFLEGFQSRWRGFGIRYVEKIIQNPFSLEVLSRFRISAKHLEIFPKPQIHIEIESERTFKAKFSLGVCRSVQTSICLGSDWNEKSFPTRKHANQMKKNSSERVFLRKLNVFLIWTTFSNEATSGRTFASVSSHSSRKASCIPDLNLIQGQPPANHWL